MSKHAKTKAKNKKVRNTPEEVERRRKKRLGLISSALLTAASIVLVCIGSLLCEYNYNYVSLDDVSDVDLGITSDTAISSNVLNIAMFGVDTRSSSSFKGNSDTIMVLSIDKEHNKIKVTSIMRDSLVKIEGHSYGAYKINSAYAGGATKAIKTINNNFHLDIREYVTVNFNGMSKIIDAMGGVEIDVTQAEVKNANKQIKDQSKRMGIQPDYITKAGLQTLNGMQAVSWARIRYVQTADGVRDDYGRTDRQRLLLEKLFDKLVTMPKSKYPNLIKTMLPFVETSLSYSDLLNLAGILQSTGLNFEQSRVPQTKYVINSGYNFHGASCVYYNVEYAAKVLHAFIYDDIDPETYMEQNGIDKTPWLS